MKDARIHLVLCALNVLIHIYSSLAHFVPLVTDRYYFNGLSLYRVSQKWWARKTMINMVLYGETIGAKLSCLHILLSHCLYIISKTQALFSSVSFRDMTSNVNLHVEPFL